MTKQLAPSSAADRLAAVPAPQVRAAASPSPIGLPRPPVAPPYSIFDQAWRLCAVEGHVPTQDEITSPWACHPALIRSRELTCALARPLQKWLLPECARALTIPSPAIEDLLRATDNALAELNHHLEGTPFVGGEELSLADALWAAFVARLKMLGLREMVRSGRNAHVARFYGVMKARPSFAQAPIIETQSSIRLAVILASARMRAGGSINT